MELTTNPKLEIDDEWAKKRHSDRDEGRVLPLIRKFTSKIILLSGHDLRVAQGLFCFSRTETH